jgi:phosphatidylglycerophosphate synthase
MAAGILGGVSLAATRLPELSTAGFLLGAVFIQLRILANLFDGMVAVEQGTTSPVGELYNEIPDRVSDAATLIGAGYALGGNEPLGYIAACLAIFIAYIRAQGKAAGAHTEYCGPMAKPQRMAAMTIAALYAGLAPSRWQPQLPGGFGGTIAAVLVLIVTGEVITAVRRLRRVSSALGNLPR